MSKQVTKTVYTFKELIELGNAKAIEKARQWLIEGATDHGWHEYTIDMWKQALASIGIEDAEISFSGFWSQGDGASFTGKVDAEKLIKFFAADIKATEGIEVEDGKEAFQPWLVGKIGGKRTVDYSVLDTEDLVIELNRISHRYSHVNTVELVAYMDRHEKSEVVKDFREDAESLRKELCREIYKSLETEYECLTSDESLIENSEANDYFFDEFGRSE